MREIVEVTDLDLERKKVKSTDKNLYPYKNIGRIN